MDYENKTNWTLGQNKPNLQKAKMNVTSLITKDYIKYDDFVVRKNKPNSNPISKRPKINVNIFVTKDYENETAFRPQKNKPKQTQFQTGLDMQLNICCTLYLARKYLAFLIKSPPQNAENRGSEK